MLDRDPRDVIGISGAIKYVARMTIEVMLYVPIFIVTLIGLGLLVPVCLAAYPFVVLYERWRGDVVSR
jgi:hypothetical protein